MTAMVDYVVECASRCGQPFPVGEVVIVGRCKPIGAYESTYGYFWHVTCTPPEKGDNPFVPFGRFYVDGRNENLGHGSMTQEAVNSMFKRAKEHEPEPVFTPTQISALAAMKGATNDQIQIARKIVGMWSVDIHPAGR